MSSYYYLMASLPMLRADGEMPFSYADFLEMCRPSVSRGRYLLLRELTLSSQKGVLVAEWARFYAAVGGALLLLRSRRLGRQAREDAPKDGEVAAAVSAAVNGKDPLEAEKALIALEFQKVDELVGMHAFDDRALMGYALKLKLLERKGIFDQKKGRAEADRILGVLRRQIMLGEQE